MSSNHLKKKNNFKNKKDFYFWQMPKETKEGPMDSWIGHRHDDVSDESTIDERQSST